jgi:hypothetical protein
LATAYYRSRLLFREAMELDTLMMYSRMLTLGWQPLRVSIITARQNYARNESE